MNTPERTPTKPPVGNKPTLGDWLNRNLARIAIAASLASFGSATVRGAFAEEKSKQPNVFVYPKTPEPLKAPTVPSDLITIDELKLLPTIKEQINVGEGADAAIQRVDPVSFKNFDHVRGELRQIVVEQAELENGNFAEGQSVFVPQMPGEPQYMPPDVGTHVG